jgi:hypothetical protein
VRELLEAALDRGMPLASRSPSVQRAQPVDLRLQRVVRGARESGELLPPVDGVNLGDGREQADIEGALLLERRFEQPARLGKTWTIVARHAARYVAHDEQRAAGNRAVLIDGERLRHLGLPTCTQGLQDRVLARELIRAKHRWTSGLQPDHHAAKAGQVENQRLVRPAAARAGRRDALDPDVGIDALRKPSREARRG